ncbi:hypothetical protein Tco_0576150 [Tanacetum coccineum]
MWCLCDPTPSGWCKTDAHSIDFGPRIQNNILTSNWLERLPAGSISTWEDLTTHFLAQFFSPGRTSKLQNDILIRTIDQASDGKLHDKNAQESWALLEDLALCDNESWNDSKDFAKSVKAISLPQDVPSTSDHHLIELENQVQRLMEAHIAPKPPVKLSKFEADFKQQQSDMTNKIDTFLKAINDRMTGALPSNTVKNPKLNVNSASLVLFARSYPREDPQSSSHPLNLINAIKLCSKQTNKSLKDQPQDKTLTELLLPKRIHFVNTITVIRKEDVPKEEEGGLEYINTNPPSRPDPSISFISEKVCKLNSFLESLNLVPPSSNTQFVCTKENDEDVIFVELIKKYDDSSEEELGMDKRGNPSNLKIPCNIGHVHVDKAYIDLNSPINVLTRMQYNWIIRKQLKLREDPEGISGISNFTRRIKGMHIFLENFTYVSDFMIVEDISSIIDPRLSQIVLGKPFFEISNMTHDLSLGIMKSANGTDKIAYKMPHKIEQYNSLSDLEKEHTKSVYFRNEEDKRRGVDYVMNKILGFYKECLDRLE